MGKGFKLSRRRWLALACLAPALSCPACAKGGPAVYPVTGQALAGGRPATRATVTFHPVDAATGGTIRPTAQVNEQGDFRLTTFKEGDGAPPGEYRVTVVWYLATRTNPHDDPVPVNHLPGRYAQAGTSRLRATIREGQNALEPFRLELR